MTAIFAQTLQIARNITTCDHVQNKMHASAVGNCFYFSDKICAVVIYGMIRADCLCGGAFVVRPAGHNDIEIKQFAQFDRHGSNAARAAMDEDGFAGRRVAAFKHIVPHGEQRFRQCRGLRHFHSRWNGQANVGAGDAIFGISAARYQRTLARAQ